MGKRRTPVVWSVWRPCFVKWMIGWHLYPTGGKRCNTIINHNQGTTDIWYHCTLHQPKVAGLIEEVALTLARSGAAVAGEIIWAKNQMLCRHGSLLNKNKAQGGKPLWLKSNRKRLGFHSVVWHRPYSAAGSHVSYGCLQKITRGRSDL